MCRAWRDEAIKWQPDAHLQLCMVGNFEFKQQVRGFAKILKCVESCFPTLIIILPSHAGGRGPVQACMCWARNSPSPVTQTDYVANSRIALRVDDEHKAATRFRSMRTSSFACLEVIMHACIVPCSA